MARRTKASTKMYAYWARKQRVLAGKGSQKDRDAVKAAAKRYKKLQRAA
jgi:hypothetical protein